MTGVLFERLRLFVILSRRGCARTVIYLVLFDRLQAASYWFWLIMHKPARHHLFNPLKAFSKVKNAATDVLGAVSNKV